MIAVPFLAALLAGLVAGLYLMGLLHDRRIGDLPGPAYAAMHQMRDHTFRRVMPVLVLTLLGVLGLAALVTPSWPRWLFLLALGLFVGDVVHTIRHQRPINDLVQSWDAVAPPAGWEHARDSWAQGHGLRLALGLTAFALTLAAAMIAASAL